MMKHLFTLSFIFLSAIAFAQNLQGKLVDEKGEPLPFASVYFKGSTIGTSTNLQGDFELPNNEKYDILVFSAVGYSKVEEDKNTFLGEGKTLTIPSQAVTLKAFEVKKRKRDRAYEIMKNAISRRDFFNKQVKEYQAEIYMKGSLYLTEIPEFFLNRLDSADRPDSSELGLMFLSESFNDIQYRAPNQLKEEMKASKVSGSAVGLEGFSWNRARQVLVNLYENNIDLNVGARGFVSPLSSSAFIYYNFKYEGYFQEGDYLINKIKVDPKREGDPVFNGYIYIVEDQWNIHSADLALSKRTNIEYVDSIYFKQNFSLVNDSIFMPISVNLDIYYTILGIKASYFALGQISNYDLSKGVEAGVSKNLLFEVKQEALDKTNDFWNAERPVVLANDEKVNYNKGDSIRARLQSPEYLDSLDKAANKFSVVDFLFLGESFRKRKDSISITLPPLITALQYTSVDGAIVQLEPNYTKSKKHGYTSYTPRLRYGFASKQVDASLLFAKRYNEENYRTVQAEFGTNTIQINPEEPIGRDINSYYNLFRDINYGQYYRESFIARASISQEISNGLRGQFTLNYTQRQNLQNSIDKANPIDDDVRFTPNLQAFGDNNRKDLFFAALKFTYRPKNKFEIYPNVKRNLGSKWPRFIGDIKFAPDYFTQLSISADKRFDVGLLGTTSVYAKVGTFLGNNTVNFVDREHFIGNQTNFSHSDYRSFNLAPYYLYSAANQYTQLAAEHNFNGWIFNKIPLLRRTQLKTIIAAKYLDSDNNLGYTEFSLGIGNIFKILRLDIVQSYVNGSFSDPSLLIGISLLP